MIKCNNVNKCHIWKVANNTRKIVKLIDRKNLATQWIKMKKTDRQIKVHKIKHRKLWNLRTFKLNTFEIDVLSWRTPCTCYAWQFLQCYIFIKYYDINTVQFVYISGSQQTYVRWGKKICGTNSTLIYSGTCTYKNI